MPNESVANVSSLRTRASTPMSVEALASAEFPFAVKLVRGNDERTVQVGSGTTAAGEA